MHLQNARPYQVSYIENPSQGQLKQLASLYTPATLETSAGSLNKITRNKSRMAKYTYVIIDDPSESVHWNHQPILAADASILIRQQQAYIKQKGEMIALDGYLGIGEHAVPVTWLYTLEGANIAGMQSVLSFSREEVETPLNDEFTPVFKVVYTPDFRPDGTPGEQAILVDLKNWTTYIMGPDYFGESKKAMLRMLNQYVYEMGGLVLHAGAKAVTKSDGTRLMMTIMGLSGTGKTTTTFSSQGELTEPVQDDMVALWPGGEVSVTENGCFAKIENLTEESEPVIFAGTTSNDAWLENAFLEKDGSFNFGKQYLTPNEVNSYKDILLATGADKGHLELYTGGKIALSDILDEGGIPRDGWDFVAWTGNGRSIIPMSSIPGAADLHDLPQVRTMGILNRDEGIDACTPGVVRFISPSQAAGYFMLGETSKTSAAGKERGKTRSPFTQPFFPGTHNLQAERFKVLASTMPDVTMWMMNTGYVGGSSKDTHALKVKISHSSAILESLLSDEIAWIKDPDFDYEIVDINSSLNSNLLEKVPATILNPALYYLQTNRAEEYRRWVRNMKQERREFLESHGVSTEIVNAVCGK